MGCITRQATSTGVKSDESYNLENIICMVGPIFLQRTEEPALHMFLSIVETPLVPGSPGSVRVRDIVNDFQQLCVA